MNNSQDKFINYCDDWGENHYLQVVVNKNKYKWFIKFYENNTEFLQIDAVFPNIEFNNGFWVNLDDDDKINILKLIPDIVKPTQNTAETFGHKYLFYRWVNKY